MAAAATPQLRRAGRRLYLTTHGRAAPELGDGIVEAYTSVFGVEFTEGGGFSSRQVQIEPGAFADSLAAKPTAPIMWEHNWDGGPIGQSVQEEETDQGLRMIGELFIAEELPRRVYRAMRPADGAEQGALTEWSIGFWPIRTVREERGSEEDPQEPLFHYEAIDRAEHSVVLRGANPLTETISVNSRGVVLDRFGAPLEDRACTGMPTEFVLAGRRYVAAAAEDGCLAPARLAGRLPAALTVGGVTYVADLGDTDVPQPAASNRSGAAADRLLSRAAVRAAFGP